MTAGRGARLGAAAALAACATLPLANWIPGGHQAPFYETRVTEWWSGTLVALGLGVVLALASRRVPALWAEGGYARLAARLDLLAPGRSLLLAVGAMALYALVARLVLGARPLLIDEIVQVWQARHYAGGQLSVPSPGSPALFGWTNVAEHGGRMFAQFPAGGPAMLALGTLLHAEWLVGPLFAGLGVWGWAAVLRRAELPRPAATTALLLLALAPFAVFMSASHMNHVTALAWLLAGTAGLATVTTSARPRPVVALLLGLAFGVAGTIRPADALAFGAPAGLWLLIRAARDRSRAWECLLAAGGMAVPLAALLWINARTTGHPLLFGYSLLWGPGHELGFHAVPWGPPHTPARGLELINLYLLQLQSVFLELPFPSLLPAILVLAFGPAWRPIERYLVVSGGLVLGLYWAYWHNGAFLGPRFLYPLLPVLALLTARLGALLAARSGAAALPVRIWWYTAAVGGAIAVAVNIPLRAREYGASYLSARWPAEAAAAEAGVREALVLVRESWGAQVIARMWGRGLSRGEAEFIYHRADMCAMEETLTRLEREGVRDTAALTELLALTADSAAVVGSALSPDRSERFRPGAVYGAGCIQRLRDDARGFTVLPPLLLETGSGNVYLRDQHALDTAAVTRYPGRPIWVLVPDDSTLGASPRFHRAPIDSLRAAWGWPAGAGGR